MIRRLTSIPTTPTPTRSVPGLWQVGELEQALEGFTRAIEVYPEEADFYGGRAWSHSELGDHRAAVADRDMAVGLAPDNPDYNGARVDPL